MPIHTPPASVADQRHPERRRWVSQTEAAEYLGITDRTLRRMIAAGKLPAYRLGPRLLRIDVADLDALMRPVPVGSGAHV